MRGDVGGSCSSLSGEIIESSGHTEAVNRDRAVGFLFGGWGEGARSAVWAT